MELDVRREEQAINTIREEEFNRRCKQVLNSWAMAGGHGSLKR